MAKKHLRQSLSSKSKYVCTKYVRTQCTLKYRFYRHVDAVRLQMYNTEFFLNVYKNSFSNLSCHATWDPYSRSAWPYPTFSSRTTAKWSKWRAITFFPGETVFKRKTGNYSNYLTDCLTGVFWGEVIKMNRRLDEGWNVNVSFVK